MKSLLIKSELLAFSKLWTENRRDWMTENYLGLKKDINPHSWKLDVYWEGCILSMLSTYTLNNNTNKKNKPWK